MSVSTEAADALNTIEFVVVDSGTRKQIDFTLDTSKIPDTTPFFAELSKSGASRLTWCGAPDLPIWISAKGYTPTLIEKSCFQTFTQLTTATRAPHS